MNKQSNKNQVIQFLCQPQGGKTYLLNALNSNSEQLFIEALHNIIDAMNQELSGNLSKKL
jgi:predicted ATPase